MDEELDAVESFEKSKNKRKIKFKDIDQKITECLDPRKTKMVVEIYKRFDCSHTFWDIFEARKEQKSEKEKNAGTMRLNILITPVY